MNNIREFFWPLLEEASPKTEEETPTPIKLNISEDCLEQAYSLQSKIVDAEDDRRKSIESKAALFIGTMSITSSVVAAASALLITNNVYTTPIVIFVILSCILSTYTVRTVWFSVKALERGQYATLGIDDINVAGTKSDYTRKIILDLQKITAYNQETINLKVDYLTMAQEYYKRAIVVVSIYTFMILAVCILGGFKRDVVQSGTNSTPAAATKMDSVHRKP